MRFVTLGPTGTCHENALHAYINYHDVRDAEIILIDRFLDGLEMVYNGDADFLMQNSAHVQVSDVTEKHYREIFVADTFLYTTKEIVVLEDIRVATPETVGLVSATEGYLHDVHYPKKIYETSKPVVGAKFLEGAYDAAVTYLEYHLNNPGRFRLRKYVGFVPTAWLVYGRTTVFDGEMMGIAPRGFYTSGAGASGWPHGGSVYQPPQGIVVDGPREPATAEQ